MGTDKISERGLMVLLEVEDEDDEIDDAALERAMKERVVCSTRHRQGPEGRKVSR